MAGTAPFPPSTHFNSPPRSSTEFSAHSPPSSQFFMGDLNSQVFPPLAEQVSLQTKRSAVENRRHGSNGVNNNGAVAVPPPVTNRSGHNSARSINAIHSLDGPRSPPSGKNTSHVPCKFFRQGACQAGKACPFSHAIDVATDHTPCKYFAKGNCKFGHKCALAHILPDGRRVNRHTLPAMTGSHLNLGGRIIPDNFPHQQSALANSLLQANTVSSRAYGSQYPFTSSDEFQSSRLQHGSRDLDFVPKIDTNFASNPNSTYGSPRDDGRNAFSPKHLTALDAPFPASFDSNGISWNARYGPAAASVPSKFGLESPSHSYSRQFGPPSRTLRNLHDSAFGGAGPEPSRPNNTTLSSSPTTGTVPDNSHSILVPLHSRRLLKSSGMSSSVPRQMPRNLSSPTEEWGDETDAAHFAFEEDLVPNSLHELLTDQEKQRRFSRTEADADAVRRTLRNGSSNTVAVGSPSAGSGTSPSSRFGPLFTRQRPSNTRDDETSSNGTGTSAFGHVGSPLRHSSLFSQHVSRNSTDRNDSDSVNLGSSPSAIGMISQQLHNSHISKSSIGDDTPGLGQAGTGRHLSPHNGRIPPGPNGSARPRGLGPSIDEEKEALVFSMEEEEDVKRNTGAGAGPWSRV
ncbi:MAG: hypothetical protein M1814_006049 [Vezdaea aestivalis]|nr:MAG: hypothetical protein M1814_006049 [Vezdaea aestivalis]